MFSLNLQKDIQYLTIYINGLTKVKFNCIFKKLRVLFNSL